MADIITVTGLSEEAKKYQTQLRMLPYYILGEELAKQGISLMQVRGIDVMIQAQRRGDMLRPYVAGFIAQNDDAMRFREATLETKTAYISMQDNITNYVTKKMLNQPQGGTGINQTKKHPFEDLVTANVVKTASEDVLDALFTGVYNTGAITPSAQDCFDGFETKIADLVTAGDISAGNKNLVTTGAIVAPVDETDFTAIEQVVAFIRSASKLLRRSGVLSLPLGIYQFMMDALENKYSARAWDLNGVENYINQKSASNIRLVTSDHMGIGDRLILTTPGNLHFGMDTMGDLDFVQVRNVETDPNTVQFWLQAGFGTRIFSIHPKEFQVNDGSLTADALSGDYTV